MALKKKKIAILGAGNMGEALAKGLLRAGKLPPEALTCTDAPSPACPLARLAAPRFWGFSS